MRNPAWRPTESNADRLASISHHLLGQRGAPAGTQESAVVRKVPIVAAVHPQHPRRALQPYVLAEALTRELNRCSEKPGPRWEASVTRDLADSEARFAVMLATASPPGIQDAYLAIKALADPHTRPLGVVFSGASDADLGRRCQEKLLEGAQRFLGVPLRDLGVVARAGPELDAAVKEIARTILDAWET